MLTSSLGLALMALSQDELSKATARIRELLLPGARLVENAKREIDLQIQELSLVAAYQGGESAEIREHQRPLLRLSPSVQSLLRLHSSPLFPGALENLFDPWMQSVRTHQERTASFATFQDAVNSLTELRTKTALLHRAVDREFSVQLLNQSESSRAYLRYWAYALVLGFICSIAFVLLTWRWIAPLGRMSAWLEGGDNASPPPASALGTGLAAPPSEVQDLVEALRRHLMRFQEQARELERRAEKLADNERAASTLFAGYAHLVRHNEELLEELLKKERLASMSEMAAQLAHEIRNPLNSMSLKLEVLREDLPAGQRPVLDRVLDEIDRLDALTESHLSRTRSTLRGGGASLPLSEADGCELGALARETIDLVSASFREKQVSLSFDAPNDQVSLDVPKTILKSALINLLRNAEDAVGESLERHVHVRASAQGGNWRLEVLDTGCGFPEDFLAQPIESFRTSKDGGSGLGLATTQKMLEAYGIRLEIGRASSRPWVTSVACAGTVGKERPASAVPKEQNA
jgi:two-component system sensor histidine kinase HydH